MTTNEIAAGVQGGQADYLQLWEAVRGFVHDRAYRWARALNGVTIDDLQQCAFLALVETVGSWDKDRGAFLTLYGLKLQAAFTEAAGLRTERDKRDPLRTAVSLDTPLTDNEADSLTLSDVIPDPVAAIDTVAELDFQQRRHNALEKALARLPEAQRAAVVGKCCYGRRVDASAYNAGMRALRHPSISRELRQYV